MKIDDRVTNIKSRGAIISFTKFCSFRVKVTVPKKELFSVLTMHELKLEV